MTPKRQIETNLIHAGEPSPRIEGAVAMPIFQSATFTFDERHAGDHDALRYIRLNNTPNHAALADKLASLEGAGRAVVAASGMAAIGGALRAVLKPGDHLVAQKGLYGGTHTFVTQELPSIGVEVDLVDGASAASFAKAIRPTTKALYVETITNPLMEVGDLPGVAALARERGLVSMIDNTFASPYLFRPVEHGFDLVLHSCTKYLNGHSDVVAGAAAGRASLVDAIHKRLNMTGGCLNPHACFLLHRGMKTLAVRVEAQCKNALALAWMLEAHPAVAKVNYPGLSTRPDYARIKTLLPKGFGGMLSFDLVGGAAAADRFFSALTIPIVAPSLGGVETLVIRPAVTSHAGLSADERRALGIGDGLVRMSVGIEAIDDLLDDVRRALDAAT